MILEFIQTHWLELTIVALFFIGAIVYIAWLFKKKGLRGVVVDLIVIAEKEFKQGENEEKLNYVIDKLIALIPTPFNLFITRETVKKFIQKIFDEVKEALDYQKK